MLGSWFLQHRAKEEFETSAQREEGVVQQIRVQQAKAELMLREELGFCPGQLIASGVGVKLQE